MLTHYSTPIHTENGLFSCVLQSLLITQSGNKNECAHARKQTQGHNGKMTTNVYSNFIYQSNG